jgi:hypothetical protein
MHPYISFSSKDNITSQRSHIGTWHHGYTVGAKKYLAPQIFMLESYFTALKQAPQNFTGNWSWALMG